MLERPGLTLVNHGVSGTSEIIPGKVYDDDHNYSKLVFNTHFPWEDHNPQGGTSMEYSFRSLDPREVAGADINFYLTGRAVENDAARNSSYVTSQSILFSGRRDGVLYRQLIMRKPPNNGVGYIIDLAEITVPGGVILGWIGAASRSSTSSPSAISGCPTWTTRPPWWRSCRERRSG